MANLFSLSLLTEYSAKYRACIFRVKAFLKTYGLKSTKSAEDAVGVKIGNLKDSAITLERLISSVNNGPIIPIVLGVLAKSLKVFSIDTELDESLTFKKILLL